MKITRRQFITIAITTVSILIVFAVYKFGTSFAPGSYPFAERYELNASEDKVINAVKSFKADVTTMALPKDLPDGRRDSLDHWYHIYFFLKQENLIVKTWLRPAGKNKTTFAFVAVNDGLVIGNWKFINHDLNDSENDKLIEKFKSRILTPIKQRLKEGSL